MRHPKNTFIPLDIQCFWCNGHMKRGTCRTGTAIENVTYFCEECGAVSHFAVSDRVKISSIEVEYKASEPVRNQETKAQGLPKEARA